MTSETHIFYDARIHQRAVNYLFTAYFTSPHSEEKVAVELWACYRHLLEGGGIGELPISLINKRIAVAAIKKILRGELVLFEDPETPDQGEQDEHGDHGDHPRQEVQVQVVRPVRVGRRG